MSDGSDEDRDELRALAGGLHALLDQLYESGAIGLEAAPPRERMRATREAPRTQEPSPSRDRAAPPAKPAPIALPPRASFASTTTAFDVPADEAGRRQRLVALKEIVAGCVRCPLHATRTQTVFSRGRDVGCELMFVGEGPGAEEDATGLPFVGNAGQLLDRMIAAMGFSPDEVYIANIVKCRPPENRTPEPNEISTCEGYLHEQIALVQPKVIVALGATAVEGLLKLSGITKLRGNWRLYRNEVPVMPTFHPSHVLRYPPSKRDVWEDLKLVMAKLGKPLQKPT